MSDSVFELLAPAGSYDTFKAVIAAGADAVYVGGDMFGARAYANNFNQEELISAIKYAHLRGRKVFLTVNTLLKNDEINKNLIEYIKPYYEVGLDAVLVQDFGTLSLLHSVFPDLPLHTSTQMTVTSAYGARFLKKYGVTRIVMAREVSLAEMKKIHDETGLEIEAFVHGALCYCYSGQCLFSSMLGGRSGNRGRCAQPCRLPYQVLSERKENINDETYILSLKDMCGIEDLKELHDAGVYSLKIEGRMKQTAYAAGIVSYYRKYIDKYDSDFKKISLTPADKEAVYALGNRCGFSDRYYFKHNDSDMVTYIKPSYTTSDEKLHEHILDMYGNPDNRLKITGFAYFKAGEPGLLTVNYGEYSVNVYGNKVDIAKNAPVTREQIDLRLRKTGESEFVFDDLYIEMDDNIFVPNGELNRLRREALEKLEEEILSSTYRKFVSTHSENNKINNSDNLNVSLSVSLENRSIIDLCLNRDSIDRIYIDFEAYSKTGFTTDVVSDCEKVKNSTKHYYLILPAIFRADTSEFFNRDDIINALTDIDGFVVKNYEGLEYVKSNFSDKDIVLDHNMYTYNDYAVSAFAAEGAMINTVPLELNAREIAGRNNSMSEMIIYGYYPLMTSAQCINKNSLGCDKCKKTLYLKDRYQKLFPVRNKCNECYNVIYNSVPTMLFNSLDKIKNYGINRYRLSFTIEDKATVANILDLFIDYNSGSLDFDCTNGHFKRGVE